MELNKTEKCYNCKYFDRYYFKSVKHFNKTTFGWCCQKQENVYIRTPCDKFSAKQKMKKPSYLIKYYIDDLLTELSSIRKVIENNQFGENEEDEDENLQ